MSEEQAKYDGKARHTPGPWFVMPNGFYVADKKVWFEDDGSRRGETPNIIIECPTEADAHLIAAAPEMRAALIRMVERYELYMETGVPADAEESKSIRQRERINDPAIGH